jgi:hypothetical protein
MAARRPKRRRVSAITMASMATSMAIWIRYTPG